MGDERGSGASHANHGEREVHNGEERRRGGRHLYGTLCCFRPRTVNEVQCHDVQERNHDQVTVLQLHQMSEERTGEMFVQVTLEAEQTRPEHEGGHEGFQMHDEIGLCNDDENVL